MPFDKGEMGLISDGHSRKRPVIKGASLTLSLKNMLEILSFCPPPNYFLFFSAPVAHWSS